MTTPARRAGRYTPKAQIKKMFAIQPFAKCVHFENGEEAFAQRGKGRKKVCM